MEENIKSNYSVPNWYWSKGLHDAEILSCKAVKLEYDYKTKTPIRNYLELEINSKSALFDTSVKSIKFYNFKCENIENLEHSFWLEDDLKINHEKYELSISLLKSKGNIIKLSIFFEDAKVER